MLNASARNSNAVLSLMAKCLKRAMSKFVRLGLRKKLRPTSPNVRPVGATKALGLYQYFTYAFDVTALGGGTFCLGLLTRSGYDPVPTPFPTPALSPNVEPLVTLSGTPVENATMPDHCQPPRAVCRAP